VRRRHGDYRAVPARQRDDVRSLAMSPSIENAVGEDELQAGVHCLGALQLLLEVAISECRYTAVWHFVMVLREADRVDDRRVIQLVGDDDVCSLSSVATRPSFAFQQLT